MSGGERRGDGQEERNSTGKNEGWQVTVHNVNAQTVIGGLDKDCASLLGCCFHCAQAQGLLQCIGGREAFQAAVLKHGIVLSAHGPYSKSWGGSPNVVRVVLAVQGSCRQTGSTSLVLVSLQVKSMLLLRPPPSLALTLLLLLLLGMPLSQLLQELPKCWTCQSAVSHATSPPLTAW